MEQLFQALGYDAPTVLYIHQDGTVSEPSVVWVTAAQSRRYRAGRTVMDDHPYSVQYTQF